MYIIIHQIDARVNNPEIIRWIMEGLWVKHYEFTKWIILACVFTTDGLWEEFCCYGFSDSNMWVVASFRHHERQFVFRFYMSVGFSLPTRTPYLIALKGDEEDCTASSSNSSSSSSSNSNGNSSKIIYFNYHNSSLIFNSCCFRVIVQPVFGRTYYHPASIMTMTMMTQQRRCKL